MATAPNQYTKRTTLEDLLFEEKNKTYGAFQLRQSYQRHLIIAALGGILFVLLAIFGPRLAALLSTEEVVEAPPARIVSVTELDAPPPLDETKPPPPPPDIPPPPVEVIKFTAPKLVEEKQEDPPPPVEELKKTNTGSENVEGVKVAVPDPGPVAPPPPPPPEKKKPEIYEVVDEDPVFPGGFSAFQKYLVNNIQYPEFARENNIQGRVTLQILIDEKGKVSDIKEIRSPHPLLTKEAARVISATTWTPAKVNNNPVKYRYTVPVTFRIR